MYTSWRFEECLSADKGFLVRYQSGVSNVLNDLGDIVLICDQWGHWYVHEPLIIWGVFDDEEGIPLRLAFEVDLWLIDNGFEIDQPFMIPEKQLKSFQLKEE